MRLTKLTMKNFRLFPDFSIDFHPELTVIVAPNGGGKTTVLDAIRIAYGPFLSMFPTGRAKGVENDDVRQLRSESQYHKMSHSLPVIIQVDGELQVDNQIKWERKKATLKGKTSIKDARRLSEYASQLYADTVINDNWPLLAYYGTGRLWNQLKLTERKVFNSGFNFREAGYLDCMEPASSYKFFVDWFRYVTRSDGDMKLQFIEKNPLATAEQVAEFKGPFSVLLQVVRKAVNTVLKPTGWGNMVYSLSMGDVTVEHPEFGVLAVSQMSDGIRNSFALAADIAWRCVQLNAHLEDRAALETEGIVLIDEVDMHLHPEWQQLVLGTLREAFPSIQFIVTTHSPQVLTTLRKANIRILACDEENNWIASEPDKSPLAHESGDALAFIMGTHPRPEMSDILPDIHAFELLARSGKSNSEEAIQIKQRLDAAGFEFNEADLSLFEFLARRAMQEKAGKA